MAAKEVWKSVPGHKGYEVSDQGRVRSVDRYIEYTFTSPRYPNGRHDRRLHKGRILKPKWVVGSRYALVGLNDQQPAYVHHLVMLAFVGPCPRDKIVRHVDDNAFNNRLANLRYGTRRDNWDDAVRNGGARLGERNHFAKLTTEAVRHIRQSKDSHATLAAQYGVALATINNVRSGRAWRWLDGDDSSGNIRSTE